MSLKKSEAMTAKRRIEHHVGVEGDQAKGRLCALTEKGVLR